MADRQRKAEGQPAEETLSGIESFKEDMYFWLQALVAVLVGLILIFTFVGRVIGVVGRSMLPTLHNGDMLLLQGIGYEPRQGDVVVLTKEFGRVEGPIVKRVIATEGQTVRIDYGTSSVYVDGERLEEDYINEPMRSPGVNTITDVTVPEGSIFVMGDNRNNSSDSRDPALGTVDERYVLGRVLFVLFPFRSFGVVR